MPIFIKNVMNGTESTYGLTEAAFAAGSLLSGILILKLFKVNRLTLGIIIL
ncbi:MAG: hypothetical protein LRY27_04555 [Chitinophagales bacterium]|nr:hypothetical protein [Chitinophagales bacterium]